ncbi:G-type lectin S-receptor-like serine/threonine-protein kinase LECRK3 [Magnolia sinica]|uniref:G-type lectin S-receptor-like serine/threonine-protein kinase LECRK3 n=1 Tax=Magnolia sinica TaxID=86752 RepID=UPI0026595132|nr:G-type lectin S-receptor-like serine/threonine-protein kinase LECRK3 [Magnolia sinica]
MATIRLLLLFLSIFSTATAQPKDTHINLGSSLSTSTNSTSWLSPLRLFAFGFYHEGAGFRVGIWLDASPNKTIVWTANRDDPPISSNSTLLLMSNGLVLQTTGAQQKILLGEISSASLSSASMRDSGNLVFYNSKNEIIWESFDSPTDTILGGQYLPSDTELFSSASETDHSIGRFRMKMQSDSNLVLYPKDTSDTYFDAYWATSTYNKAGMSLKLHLYLYEDGNMYLVNNTDYNSSLVAEGGVADNGIVIYRATIDVDGIFRLYSHIFPRNGIPIMTTDWEALSDKCEVKGICGYYSYCNLVDDQPDCRCLPGYNFTDPDQRFKGCGRNFTAEVCNGKNENFTMENMHFGAYYYSISSTKIDECREACLSDCNCEAAMFENNNCMKFSRPLRYGKLAVSNTVSTTAFTKVAIDIPVIANSTNSSPNATMMVAVEIKKEPRGKILIAVIILATCSVASIAFSCFLVYRNRAQSYRKMIEDNNLRLSEEIVLRSFSYNELVKATDNFKEELGKGSFGTVYKGTLYNSNRTVAVKRLEKVFEEGEREFRAETRAIGRTHHRNLVRLLGFCDEGSARLLVYEYMSEGSLANLPFKAQSRPDWKERVRIALDVARGIFYLHEECEPHIIHCDIKPQNILMDGFWTAKISDFGLSKLLMPDQTRTFTGVRGTRGYLAPEWYKNTPISVKTDVFSYGIVLLEIICCRRYIELLVPDNEIVLTDWVHSCFVSGELHKLLGGEEVEVKTLDRMVKVGLWCIQDEPALRPSMKNVILMIEGNMDIPIPPSPTSS